MMNEGFKAYLNKISITVPDLFISVKTIRTVQEKNKNKNK